MSSVPGTASRTEERAAARSSARPGRTRLAQANLIGPLAALVGLCLAFAVSADRFASPANLRAIADQAAIPLVLAIGLTFVVVMGSIDLSLQGVMAASALVTSLLVANDRTGLSLGALGIVAAVGVGAALGLVSGLVHTRLRVPSFLATLGVGSIGLGIATLLFGQRPPRILDPGVREIGLQSILGVPWLAVLALAVLALGLVVQTHTRLGRYAFAIGGGEDVARLSGIRVERWKILAFVFAGALFGLAGAMAAARVGVGSPTTGDGQLFAAITAVVVGGTLLSGGRGGVVNALVGVLIITVLGNGLVLLGVDSSVQVAVQGAIIVVAVTATTWSSRARLRVIK